MIDFARHPELDGLLLSALLLANGWFDYRTGLRIVSYASWFLGGIMGAVTLSTVAVDYGVCLGTFRWVVAAIVLVAGMLIVFRFRPGPFSIQA